MWNERKLGLNKEGRCFYLRFLTKTKTFAEHQAWTSIMVYVWKLNLNSVIQCTSPMKPFTEYKIRKPNLTQHFSEDLQHIHYWEHHLTPSREEFSATPKLELLRCFAQFEWVFIGGQSKAVFVWRGVERGRENWLVAVFEKQRGKKHWDGKRFRMCLLCKPLIYTVYNTNRQK